MMTWKEFGSLMFTGFMALLAVVAIFALFLFAASYFGNWIWAIPAAIAFTFLLGLAIQGSRG